MTGQGGHHATQDVALEIQSRHVALGRALRRTLAWRKPPNWSAQDWRDEMVAATNAAGCQAENDFDLSKGIPLEAFLYQRAVARTFTRYRQEWAYVRHCMTEHSSKEMSCDATELVPDPSSLDKVGIVSGDSDIYDGELLHSAISSLPLESQEVLQLIFWDENTEVEIAGKLGISHQAVSKRKLTAMKRLRGQMNAKKNRQANGCRKRATLHP